MRSVISFVISLHLILQMFENFILKIQKCKIQTDLNKPSTCVIKAGVDRTSSSFMATQHLKCSSRRSWMANGLGLVLLDIAIAADETSSTVVFIDIRGLKVKFL